MTNNKTIKGELQSLHANALILGLLMEMLRDHLERTITQNLIKLLKYDSHHHLVQRMLLISLESILQMLLGKQDLNKPQIKALLSKDFQRNIVLQLK